MAFNFLTGKRSLLEENVHVYACMLVRSDIHLVCASAALHAYILVSQTYAFGMCMHLWMGTYFRVMVSQTYAFGMCKSAVLNGYTIPEVWCLKHMHSLYASAVFIRYKFPEVWCLKHKHSVCASDAFKACILVSPTCAFGMCKRC